MSILHISDTHGLHKQLTNLPGADVIVCSGDFTMTGTKREVVDFLDWFCDLPYSYKIFVAGNHDDCLCGAGIAGLDSNCYYLCNSGVDIGGMYFYGIPMFVEDDLTGNYRNNIRAIPLNTDVLITHQPPFGILDFADNRHYGDRELLHRVELVKPQFHLFGHVHPAYGMASYRGITFSNAALVNENYDLTSPPMELKILFRASLR